MMCGAITTETAGGNKMPCQNVLDATSNQIKLTQSMNELESYSQHYVYKNMNPELLKTLIALGFIQNSIQQQKVIAIFPVKPFEFNLNIGLQNQQYGIKYKLDF
jgi:hypothetical protein